MEGVNGRYVGIGNMHYFANFHDDLDKNSVAIDLFGE